MSIAEEARRVALVISSLGLGGAERVISTLANKWVAQGRPVDLITMDAKVADAYPLDDRVRRVRLNVASASGSIPQAVWQNGRRIQALSNALRCLHPASVVSFMDRTNVISILSANALHIPIAVAERNDPREHNAGTAWTMLRRLTYPGATALVVQTTSLSEWAESMMRGRMVRVIPNPVAAPGVLPASRPGNVVIAMGRLVPQKGFDLLLRAFAVAHDGRPGWKLRILGEGPQRGLLTRLSKELGIANHVELCGAVPDPGAWLSRADIFVLSSRYEGYPNALLEAMAHGLAVVSMDCRSGPAEIIRSGRDGLLVPCGDVERLAAAIARLMDDPLARVGLGEEARKVLLRHGEDSILSMWDDLLCSMLSRTRLSCHRC